MHAVIMISLLYIVNMFKVSENIYQWKHTPYTDEQFFIKIILFRFKHINKRLDIYYICSDVFTIVKYAYHFAVGFGFPVNFTVRLTVSSSLTVTSFKPFSNDAALVSAKRKYYESLFKTIFIDKFNLNKRM